jgi:hypothetical protein
VDSSSERRNMIFPPLRSWWWITVAASLFATAAAAGFVAKSLGPLAPELGLDISLSHGRNGALIAVSEAIHYGLGPAGAVALVLCGSAGGRSRLWRSGLSLLSGGWLQRQARFW